ncbi:MAG: restriction endonuclease subunit S [Candidatus Accumulibacter sp.]|uniref:restriction endonuclease subunit S n=1 Tax=Accumulibacter sp. TaxID=2053492 RepID=UPI00258619A0|nr:restriction endonuclease subunit S [Accumulibacter sp.]MCM8621764.1 restriction endonuclease subunit S [Accumulibacter sp.]
MTSSTAKLGEVADVVRGVTYSADDVSDGPKDGFLPILRAGNIGEELKIGNDLVWVPANLIRAAQKVRQNDLVMCTSSGSAEVVGKLAKSPKDWDGSFGAFCAVVRSRNGKSDPAYLAHFLRSPSFKRWTKKSLGANIKNIRKSELEEFEVPSPPIIEQRRIAAILDKADSIQKKRREAIRLADDFLRSVFLDIFGGLLSGPTDQWQALSTCTDFIDYRGKTPEKSDAGVRLITAKNVRDGVINVEPAEFISEETYSWWMSRGYPQSGDVLFTTEAPLGNIAVLRTDEPIAIGQRLIAIRPREMLRSDYLSWALRQDVIQRDIFSRATGSTVKGIRSAELVQVRVPIANYDDQLKFERIVASVNHQKEVMHASAAQGEQLFQALQQQAFQGQL